MFCLGPILLVKGLMVIASQPEIVLSRASFRDSGVCARSGHRNAVIAEVNQTSCIAELYGEQRRYSSLIAASLHSELDAWGSVARSRPRWNKIT